VGSLEGWLVLAIFLAVAIVVVGRIQSGLSRARASEREAIFMYELSTALAGLRTQDAVVHALPAPQQMFLATLVQVSIQPGNQSSPIRVKAPPDGAASGKPDRVLPILAAPGLWVKSICGVVMAGCRRKIAACFRTFLRRPRWRWSARSWPRLSHA